MEKGILMATNRISRPKADRPRPRRNSADRDEEDEDPDFIQESVRNAYRVVEPWMKQGQRVARQLSRAAYGPLNNLPDGARDIQGRWLQASGEMVATWFDMLGMASQWMTPNGDAADDRRDRSHVASITYDISSHLPIRVRTRFTARAAQVALKAPRFKKRDGIRVQFRTNAEGRLAVRVTVREDLPPGKHTSAIIDAYSGETVGRIRIVLG